MSSDPARWLALVLLPLGSAAWAAAPRVASPARPDVPSLVRHAVLGTAPQRPAHSRLSVAAARSATLGGPGALHAGAQGGRRDGPQGINGSTLQRRVPR